MEPKRKTLTMYESALKKVRFKGTSKDDIRAYYKAYQMGALKDFNPAFSPDESFSQKDFEILFSDYVNSNHLLTVTFFGFKDDVEIPVGFGAFRMRGRIVEVDGLLWFPWATQKQILLSAVNFYDTFRKVTHEASSRNFKVLEFARKRDEKFFEKMVTMGILQKVGTFDGFYHNEDCVMYVTKEIKE